MRRPTIFASLLVLALGTDARAEPSKQTNPDLVQPVAPAEIKSHSAVKATPLMVDAMMLLIDKMFPPQPDPQPARLVLAKTSVQAMWPDGAYAKLMTGLAGSMLDHMMQMKASDFPMAGTAGQKSAAAQAASDRTVHDAAATKDPHFDERMAAMRTVLNEEAAKISTIIDPRMRDGLARAMARRLDAQQLTDINVFFATPSGHAMASQFMQLWVDPDTIRSMVGALPELMKLMPEMSQKIKAVSDRYPSPPGSSPSVGKR